MKSKKVFGSIIFMWILLAIFTITTFALINTSLILYDINLGTGNVKINFNNDEKVFNETDLILNPGSSVRKTMTVKNIGNGDVYFKIYMENIEGDLSGILQFKIYKNNQIIKTFKATDFTYENAFSPEMVLKVDETTIYEIEAYMPEYSNVPYENAYIIFDLKVTAVQSKNNDGKLF